MTPRENELLFQKLYGLFEGATPLKTDCGTACGGACCRGDENTGMLLFPGEKTTLAVRRSEERRLAVCPGECSRSQRPLACRIFPLFPFVDERGTVRVRVDPRALSVCPLARQWENVRYSRRFVRRVRKAGRLLLQSPETAAFLRELSAELAEIEEMQRVLRD